MFIRDRSSTFRNVAEVARAEVIQTGGPRVHGHAVPGAVTKLYDAAGRDIGVVGEIDLERLSSPVIPAGPPAIMLCITPTGEVTAALIIGWRVLRTGLEPLHVVEPAIGATRFMVVGGQGLVRLSDGVIFAGIEQAKTSVVEVAHPDPAPVEIEPAPKTAAGRRRG